MSEETVRPRVPTVQVTARGALVRVARVQGNLFVCSRQSGSCCCGWEEKGRLPFEQALWSDEWERRALRTRLHLTFSGCLGPCMAGNNALLQLFGRSIWLKDLNDAALVPLVFDYVEALLDAERPLPPPAALRDHIYARYLPGVAADESAAADPPEAGDDDWSRLDPVCLMDVEPATARHSTVYRGRTVLFCAPSCKKQFLADPLAFVAG